MQGNAYTPIAGQVWMNYVSSSYTKSSYTPSSITDMNGNAYTGSSVYSNYVASSYKAPSYTASSITDMNGNAYTPSQVWTDYSKSSLTTSGGTSYSSQTTLNLLGTYVIDGFYYPSSSGTTYHKASSRTYMVGSGTGYNTELFQINRSGGYSSVGKGNWYKCSSTTLYTVTDSITLNYFEGHVYLSGGTVTYTPSSANARNYNKSSYTAPSYTASSAEPKIYHASSYTKESYTASSAEPRIYKPSKGGDTAITPAVFSAQQIEVLTI